MFYLLRDDRSTDKCSFDCLFPISTSSLLLSFISQLRDIVQNWVSSDDFECNFNVKKSSLLFHKYPCIKTGPDFDVMSIKRVCFAWVERLRSNLFEPESSHHAVEEDFEEHQMVSISWFYLLNPLDDDLEFWTLVFSVIDRKVCTLPETVDAGSPVNEELKLLFNLVPDSPKDILSHLLRIVR